jgi:SAM-dependent methyltransferase
VKTENREQAEHWNRGDEVGHWISQQDAYDRMFAPFAEMIIDAAAIRPGERVLDIGCGCGATTLAVARFLGAGESVGIDLSGPMLERARADATAAGQTNARFLQADAQVAEFGGESFDAVISRFGIMFFADPIRAFANIRSATRNRGRLAFVCWQPLIENEWLLVPGGAIAQHVPLPDLGSPNAPGMFAFADPDRIRGILTDAGWHDINVTSRHTPLLVGGGGTVDDAVEFLRTGSIGRTVLAGADAATTERAIREVGDALSAHFTADGVQLDAAVWLVQASA